MVANELEMFADRLSETSRNTEYTKFTLELIVFFPSINLRRLLVLDKTKHLLSLLLITYENKSMYVRLARLLLIITI